MSKTKVNLSFGLKPDFRVKFRLWSKTEFKTWFKWKDKLTQCCCVFVCSAVTLQPLVKFMISLFLVYFAEYFINQALVCLTCVISFS